MRVYLHAHTLETLQKRLNITKTVRKTPINLELQRTGAAVDDSHKKKDPKYDHEDRFVSARVGGGRQCAGKGGWLLAEDRFASALPPRREGGAGSDEGEEDGGGRLP